jgi:Rieske Fe-S protein
MKDIYILGSIIGAALLFKYSKDKFLCEVKLLNEYQDKIVIKKGNKKVTVSKICSHKKCILSVIKNNLVCPCHNARFTLDGKVLQGPSTGSKIPNLDILDIEDLV